MKNGIIFIWNGVKYQFVRHKDCSSCCFNTDDSSYCYCPSTFPLCNDGCFFQLHD